VRGPEAWSYPWGNDPFDLTKLTLAKDRWSKYWEDPESTMGLGRDSGTIDGDCTRADAFGAYEGPTSPFGLTGLVRWGGEWNLADGLPDADAPRDVIYRSLADCGAQQADESMGSPSLAASNHRAFSGCVAAAYGRPRRFRTAAFRLVYGLGGVVPPPVTADESADEKLYALLGEMSDAFAAHLGRPDHSVGWDTTTSGFIHSTRTWHYVGRGLSLASSLCSGFLGESFRVTAIHLYGDFSGSRTAEFPFQRYSRALNSAGTRMGMTRDEVRRLNQGADLPTIPGCDCTGSYHGERLIRLQLTKKR
jgi:hypothetical protein